MSEHLIRPKWKTVGEKISEEEFKEMISRKVSSLNYNSWFHEIHRREIWENPETDLMQKPKRVRNDIRSEEEGKKKYIEKIKK